MSLKTSILTYIGIVLSLVVGYGYLFLSPDNWPNMTASEYEHQSTIFKVVYFSASSGVSLIGWCVAMIVVSKPLKSDASSLNKNLLRVFIGYLATQFLVDLFNGGEYILYWSVIDHSSAILLVTYSVYHAFRLAIGSKTTLK